MLQGSTLELIYYELIGKDQYCVLLYIYVCTELGKKLKYGLLNGPLNMVPFLAMIKYGHLD
jgi:hypothetical protein